MVLLLLLLLLLLWLFAPLPSPCHHYITLDNVHILLGMSVADTEPLWHYDQCLVFWQVAHHDENARLGR